MPDTPYNDLKMPILHQKNRTEQPNRTSKIFTEPQFEDPRPFSYANVMHTNKIVPTLNAGVKHRKEFAVKHSRLVIRDSIIILGRAMKYCVKMQKEEVVYHDIITIFKGIVVYK